MAKVLLVAAGGMIGALLRYGTGGFVHRLYGGTFPLGTLAVNLLGCLLIGGVMELATGRQLMTPETRVFLVTGVLGGFTTFSAFGYETVELLRQGSAGGVLLNVGANVGLGLAAVWVGIHLGRLL